MRHNVAWVFNLGAELYRWFTTQPRWQSSCRELAEMLPTDAPLRVVDIGCGPGGSTIELARARPNALVVGLDLAPRMLHQAQRRSAHGKDALPITWMCADAGRLPFLDCSVDVITGHSLLYLLPDRRRALFEIRRVLRPGGHIMLMEPHRRPVPIRQLFSFKREPRHLLASSLWRLFSRLHGRFTPRGLSVTLARSGFVSCETREVLDGLGILAHARKPSISVWEQPPDSPASEPRP